MHLLRTCRSTVAWLLAGLAGSLLLPSTAVADKYWGLPGVLIYLFAGTLGLMLFSMCRPRLTESASRLSERHVSWLAALTVGLVLATFLVIYPVANSGIVGGGSDNDDALNVATAELLHGRYPYYARTYLGNPISPLPGSLLLAAPFVLLGNSAYQNIFWLAVFFLALKSYLQDGRQALLLLWLILGLSPVVIYQIVVGIDYVANSLYVLIFTVWMVGSISKPEHKRWEKALPAVLLGIGLSSRVNFALLVPLIFSALVQRAGWRSSIGYMTITGITFGVITLPFYLVDPQGFSPLHVIQKLDQFRPVLPSAGLVVPLLTGALSLGLAFSQRPQRDLDFLLRNCAWVLAFPILWGMVLATIRSGSVDVSFAFFGTFFLFFGAVACWRER